MKRLVSIIFLIFILLSFVYVERNYFYKEKLKITNKPVEEAFQIDLEEEEELLTIPSNYLGYLIIEKLNIRSLILEGTSDDILNLNVIGIHKASVDLDSSYGNIILAGHNNRYVLGNLKNINLNDEVNLNTKKYNYRFIVNKKEIYSNTDYSYYKYIDNKKVLTLITCYGSNNYRLVITANYVE